MLRKGLKEGISDGKILDCMIHMKDAINRLTSITHSTKKIMKEDLMNASSRDEFNRIWDSNNMDDKLKQVKSSDYKERCEKEIQKRFKL